MADVVKFRSSLDAAGFTMMNNVVVRHHFIPHGEKQLYQLLLSYAWGTGECFPGQERLALEIGTADGGGVSLDTIQRYLKGLRDKGLISWVQEGYPAHNVYVIEPLDKVAFLQKPQGCSNRNHAAEEAATMRPKEDEAEEDSTVSLRDTAGGRPNVLLAQSEVKTYDATHRIEANQADTVGKRIKLPIPGGKPDEKPENGRSGKVRRMTYQFKRQQEAYSEFNTHDLLYYFCDQLKATFGTNLVPVIKRDSGFMSNFVNRAGGPAEAVKAIDKLMIDRKETHYIPSFQSLANESTVRFLLSDGYGKSESTNPVVTGGTENESVKRANQAQFEFLND